MKWMFHIPDDGLASAGRQLTITADNWFAALGDGIARCNGCAVGNISCTPTDDGSVEVRDDVSGRVFYLHPFAGGNGGAGLSTHVEIFGSRDASASDGAVSYRERLVYVPSGFSVKDSETIARDILKATMKPSADDQLVVAVHVYDHHFTERPVRPALVRIAWQQWNPNDIMVDYPQSAFDDVESDGVTSYLLTHNRDAVASRHSLGIAPGADDDSAAATDEREDCRKAKGKKVTQLSASENLTPRASDEGDLADDANRQDGERKTLPAVAAVDGGVMWAFEQLHQMYAIHSHDEAAAFIKDTLIQAIPSEACAVLLNAPGKDELYIAAEQGFSDVIPENLRIPIIGGIVGAALRLGAVMNVTDPDDERFNTEVDLRGSFSVSNVLVAPIAFEGHTFGVIELFNREVGVSFDQEDANALSYVAGAFAEYICNSLPSREPDFSDKEFEVLKAEAARQAEARRKADLEARRAAAAKREEIMRKRKAAVSPESADGPSKKNAASIRPSGKTGRSGADARHDASADTVNRKVKQKKTDATAPGRKAKPSKR